MILYRVQRWIEKLMSLMKHPSGPLRKDMQFFKNQKPGHLKIFRQSGGGGE